VNRIDGSFDERDEIEARGRGLALRIRLRPPDA
jgi:hypothetical protein